MTIRFTLTVLAAGILLNACTPTQSINTQPTPTVSTQLSQSITLGSALVKRPLRLGRINGQVVPLAALANNTADSFSTKLSIAEPDIAIAPGGFYYGGHDFNRFTIQYAEENIYPAANADSLLGVYNGSVQNILKEWDSSARLLESRAQLNAEHAEFIQLPGQDGKPMKIQPRYVFRFASTPKKETLNVYVLDKEIRVHRMFWGEQNIAIDRVKIDSNEALDIARKAFASKTNPPNIQVFPEQNNRQAQVVYDLPEKVKWNLNLNQQSRDQLRYFVNFNFNYNNGQPIPTPVPFPGPQPVPATLDAEASSAGVAVSTSVARPDFFPQQQLYGSIEIDAITGDIKSMNRPVNYNFRNEPSEPSEPGDPEQPPTPVDVGPPVSRPEPLPPQVEPPQPDSPDTENQA